jgi:hypothetical protein
VTGLPRQESVVDGGLYRSESERGHRWLSPSHTPIGTDRDYAVPSPSGWVITTAVGGVAAGPTVRVGPLREASVDGVVTAAMSDRLHHTEPNALKSRRLRRSMALAGIVRAG